MDDDLIPDSCVEVGCILYNGEKYVLSRMVIDLFDVIYFSKIPKHTYDEHTWYNIVSVKLQSNSGIFNELLFCNYDEFKDLFLSVTKQNLLQLPYNEII